MDLSNINKDRQAKKRNVRALDLATMVYGKIPPQAKDIEEAVLGAILLERNAIDNTLDVLHPEVFYVEAHARIFRAMIALNNKSQPIDILTVSEQLRSTEELEMVGGPYYVTKLTNSVVSSAHIESHSKILYQKYIQREMIRLGGLLVADGYEDTADVFEMIDQAENNLFAITNALHKKNYVSVDSLLVKAITEIDALRHSKANLTGVTSGFRPIDKVTHGWQPTDLIILAARPAVGKTAFALNLATNAANAGTSVGFFSLEMSSGQLIRRLMASESEIPLDKIMKGRLEEEHMKQIYEKAIQPLSQKKLFF